MSDINVEPESDTTSPAPPTRRTVLRTAGLIALAGGTAAVAACGTNNQTSGAPITTAGGSPTSAPTTSSPAASPADSPSPTESPTAHRAAPRGPSVAASRVPVGGGVILSDADYVVTQPTKGTYKAFTSICTHMGCTVAEVSGGVIRCNCHGSQFSIKDGSVANPPASKPLAEHDVTVANRRVYVTD